MARKSTVKKEEFKRCTNPECSKKDRKISDFYNSKNSIFVDGKVPICKECIKKMVDVKDIKTVYNFLKNVNLVFDVSIWNSCLESNRKDKIGEYMRRINSMIQYKGLTWDDSIFDEKNNKSQTGTDTLYEIEEDKPFKITIEMQRKWGKNLPPDEYEFLENNFNEWVNRCTCEDFTQEKIFRNICWKELEIKRARESNAPTDKLEKTLRDFMSDGQVTPKDMNNNKEENVRTIGMIIKDIEMYEPAEFYQDKELYKDVDGFGKYLDLFVFRSMKNLITNSDDFLTDEEISSAVEGVGVNTNGK